MRILLTGAEGPAGKALARQLHRLGHTVTGLDLLPVAAERRHLFAATHTVCRADSPDLVPQLRAHVAAHRIELVLPTVQDELPYVAAAAGVLGAPVAISGPGAVGLAHDKLLTALALDAAGVPVPATVPLTAGETDLAAIGRDLGSPFVLKPRIARGGRGVVVVEEPAVLDPAVLDPAALGPAGIPAGTIAQSFAGGTEYAVQVHRSCETGAALAIALEKTELKEGRVGNAVTTVRREPGSVPDVEDVAIRAVEALGVVGACDLDVRLTADGTPVVLEINARFGANSEAAPELLQRTLAEQTLTETRSAA